MFLRQFRYVYTFYIFGSSTIAQNVFFSICLFGLHWVWYSNDKSCVHVPFFVIHVNVNVFYGIQMKIFVEKIFQMLLTSEFAHWSSSDHSPWMHPMWLLWAFWRERAVVSLALPKSDRFIKIYMQNYDYKCKILVRSCAAMSIFIKDDLNRDS